MLQILPDDDQLGIIDAIARFASEQLPLSRLRPDEKAEQSELKRWPEIAGLGYLTLALPEEYDGADLSLAEEVLVYRELGRCLISPSAFATTIAAHMAVAGGHGGNVEGLVSGSVRVAPAMAVENGPALVFDDPGADLVLLRQGDELSLLPRSALRDVRPVKSLDESVELARADISIKDASLTSTNSALLLRYHLLIAAMQVGISETARDMAVDYGKERVQFGKPIGSFQAIKHSCADMAVASEMAYCQLLFAAITARDEAAGAAFQVHSAALLAGRAASQNAARSIQIHGGIGFTAEFDAHRLVKRALVLSHLSGSDSAHQAALLAQPFPA